MKNKKFLIAGIVIAVQMSMAFVANAKETTGYSFMPTHAYRLMRECNDATNVALGKAVVACSEEENGKTVDFWSADCTNLAFAGTTATITFTCR